MHPHVNQFIEELQKISMKNSSPDVPMPVVIWSDEGGYCEYSITDISCENETAYIKITKS
jgi:hypothetical protein